MTTLPPYLRKLALTAHLAVSVGWFGGVLAYLALALVAWTARDALTVWAGWIGMASIGWYVLVPLALATLGTGLIMALGTRWGLFQHYWVLFSLGLTVVATLVLVWHMPAVSDAAAAAATADRPSRVGLRGEFLHAGGGLVVLLVITGLNVYKPRALTPYGRRTRPEHRSGSRP